MSVAALFAVSSGTRIEIVPEEAKSLAEIKIIEGFGFAIGDTVYSLTGNPLISVSAQGFKAATKTIEKPHLGHVFPLELFELPGRLVASLAEDDGNMSSTVWRIDGRDAGISNKLNLQLAAGSYTVTIDNPYHLLEEAAVEIKRQEKTQLQVDLQPVAGVMRISSEPSGAVVFVDEKQAGFTPLRLEQKGGQYSLRVAAANHMDTIEQLAVTRATPELKRNYKLDLKKAKVTLNLQPTGGSLLVNGVQAATPLLLDATVEHRLTYMKEGYYTKTKTVALAADEEKQISFQLKAEMGQVEISSSPPAAVWIGTRDYGLSPVSVNLPAVAYKITFKKPGYRYVSKVVKPRGGTVQKVSVKMFTEDQARLQEAPRDFTNPAGIKLKLFVIRDALTMGAPRSEKGQRANEFQRKILLTKPFYASLFEITNSQFAEFNPQKGSGPGNTPITSISWQEGAAYCNWLSSREKLHPFYKTANGKVTGFNMQADGYRLLSEGEWEWLARKSGKERQTIFSWGDETVVPPKTANVADESAKGQVRFYVPNYSDGYSGVAPIGSLQREPSGLYDMAGNVSE